MKIVIIPGAVRTAAILDAWRGLLADHDVSFAELPGHGRQPLLPTTTVAAYIDDLETRVPVDAFVVGESLGGLAALGLAARGRRVVAFDPPLTTAKQWSIAHQMREMAATRFRGNRPFAEFIANIFGLMPDGSTEERNYYWLLDALRERVDIVTGTEPLWPENRRSIGPQCVIDDDDRAIIARHPLVTLHTLEGPHALLTERQEASRDLILRLALDRSG